MGVRASTHGTFDDFMSYFSIFGRITKESTRRRQNMDKVAKPKTCRIGILHNEKKFSDQISHFCLPQMMVLCHFGF